MNSLNVSGLLLINKWIEEWFSVEGGLPSRHGHQYPRGLGLHREPPWRTTPKEAFQRRTNRPLYRRPPYLCRDTFFLKSSGAMYVGVPLNYMVPWLRSVTFLASPKSQSLILKLSSNNMLCDFMSLWTIPLRCK